MTYKRDVHNCLVTYCFEESIFKFGLFNLDNVKILFYNFKMCLFVISFIIGQETSKTMFEVHHVRCRTPSVT